MEIPNFRAPDVQVLVQDLAQSRRDLFEERKNSANRLAEERDRSRWEIERVRTELGSEVKSLGAENQALVRAIGRLQRDADRLREENAILRHGKPSGHVEEKPAEKPAEKVDVMSSFNRPPGGLKTSVPLVMPGAPMSGRTQVMPPPQIMGAGPQIMQPGVGPL
jgi:septal ring factor EnvC (AmiA/AmiB activator)